MKTPFFHFTKKTGKTFTNEAKTKIMMISFVNIILFNQKMNECTINMSFHNLKPNHYEELILLSQSLTLLNTRHKIGWYGSFSSTTHFHYCPNCSLFIQEKYSLLVLWKYKLKTGECFPSWKLNLSHSDRVPTNKES